MRTFAHFVVVWFLVVVTAPVWATSGQVRFQGTVQSEENHAVVPICYGDYFVEVAIEQILDDPAEALNALPSVQVCYPEALALEPGSYVEVNGYYWGDGSCPKQYCQSVQIKEEGDYVAPFLIAGFGDNDWMVAGQTMVAIPTGNVGIGTSGPQEKLHVVGNVLIEGASPAWLRILGDLGDDAGVALSTLGVGVNTWRILREGSSADLKLQEVSPYPPFSNNALTVAHLTGNLGIGTDKPQRKLHVQGNVLIDGPNDGSFGAPLVVNKAGAGRQLAGDFNNPNDATDAEVEIQMTGGKMLPWGWSLRASSGHFSLGSVMTWPPALNLRSTGYVGLGVMTPSYRLELPNNANESGRARANAWYTYSSRRWKTDIRTIDRATDMVKQLRGVTFAWKDGGQRDMGLIAEEVGAVIPEIVAYDRNGIDAESIAYDHLVALLVEAVKEQDARIVELERTVARYESLADRLARLEQQLAPSGPVSSARP
jgi:hypothetical protein